MNTPKASPYRYYGWVIALVSTICIVASIPGQTAGVSVFTDHLMTAYGLSRTKLSFAYLLGTISSALLLPRAGRTLDRIGPQKMILAAAVGLSLSLFFLANAPIALGLKSELASLASITVCFLGIRHFGQGQLTLISRTVLGRFFRQYLGTVNGAMGVIVAFAFGIAPMALTGLVGIFGWQKGMVLLMAGALLAGLLGFLFFRESPEKIHIKMEEGLPEKKLRHKAYNPNNIDLPSARKTWVFWLFNLGMALQGGIITALTFHFTGICKELGLEPATAFGIFLPMAIVSTVCNIIAGISADRFPLRSLLLLKCLALSLTPLVTPHLQETWGYTICWLGFGLSGGLFTCLVSVAWPKIFGRTYLGAISGYSLSWIVMSSAVCPYAVSLLGDLVGSLTIALSYLALLPGILCLFICLKWRLIKS